jgi:hypothetical protein
MFKAAGAFLLLPGAVRAQIRGAGANKNGSGPRQKPGDGIMIDIWTRMRWRLMEKVYDWRFGYRKALSTTGVKSRHVFTLPASGGHNVYSACDIEILPIAGHCFKVVFTDIEDNKWMPITQVYADLVQALYRGYKLKGIPLSRLEWYCHGKMEEDGKSQFFKALIDWEGKTVLNLRWISVDRGEVYAGTNLLSVLHDF